MLNTLRIYEELSQVIDPKAAQKFASVLGAMYEDLQNTATKDDLNALQKVVGDLAEAQKRTEARVEELAVAQKCTEARVQELAEAQKRTEARVEELAEAQKRTEARVEELAEAQKRTEARVQELAEAQKRTETSLARLAERVDRLAERLDDTNKQLGGLSATVGYTLEDRAYPVLPSLLERDHGLQVARPLRRGYLTDAKGRDLEVNILGQGVQQGQPVWIIGEAKAQLSKNDVDRFIRNRIEPLMPVCGKVFPVLVSYMVSARDVPDYARERGVTLYLSYQFGEEFRAPTRRDNGV